MMKKVIFIFIMIFMAGCATTASQIRAKNKENMVKLYRGMTKETVLFVMGKKQLETTLDEKGLFKKPAGIVYINNPFKTEMLEGKGRVFEVLYYYTEKNKNDGEITDDELTPLVLEEGKLIGWGWNFFKNTKRKYGIRG